jgi:hypothetical protein
LKKINQRPEEQIIPMNLLASQDPLRRRQAGIVVELRKMIADLPFGVMN